MIISPKYKFIFIKTQKTAGSSIEKILLDKIKDNDPDLIFGGMLPEGMPPINIKIVAEHHGCDFIKKFYTQAWNEYFKFTIERNPWDKVVSQYFWVKKTQYHRAQSGFEDFVLYDKKIHKLAGWNLYTNNNTPVVDHIIQYDNLHNDFIEVMNYLKMSYNRELSSVFLKSDIRNNTDYKEMYSDITKEKIYNLYIEPIKYFNYSF